MLQVDGIDLREAIRRGCARSTREHPFRSSVVHPTTRVNEHTSSGLGVPVIHFDFVDAPDLLEIEMIPKGSGSEYNSWLKMALPADGVDVIKTFVIDCVLEAGGKTCPPTIVGVGDEVEEPVGALTHVANALVEIDKELLAPRHVALLVDRDPLYAPPLQVANEQAALPVGKLVARIERHARGADRRTYRARVVRPGPVSVGAGKAGAVRPVDAAPRPALASPRSFDP